MPDEGKTLSGSLVLDLRIWWRHVHTLYSLVRLGIFKDLVRINVKTQSDYFRVGNFKQWQPVATLNLLEGSVDAVIPTNQMLCVKW